MTSRAKQGGFSDWQELRDHLIDAYHETPHPSTEQEIIDAYQLHPAAIEKAALALIDVPDIRSCWAVLKTRAITIAQAPSNPTRSTGLDKERAIQRAEQWIRAAGLHYDRDSEILLELFGSPSTLLGAYATVETIADDSSDGKWKLAEPTGDVALVEHILKVYNDLRPKGIAVEEESIARAEKWKADQRRIAQLKAQALAELDAKQADTHPEATLPVNIPF